MRIISIELHNVFRFGETDNIIHFDDIFAASDDDIALITGSVDDDDNDSNGAGKSTVGEALYWAFFERLPRLSRNSEKAGKAVAEIIRTDDDNSIAKGIRQSYVEVLFHARDGRLWRLKRGSSITKGGNRSLLFELDCDGVAQGGDKKQIIADLLGAGAESVLNSIFFAQMDTGKFLSGTDSSRRNILMDLRGLVVIDRMLKVLREGPKKETNKIYDELDVRSDIIRNRIDGTNDGELRKRKLDAAKSLEGVDEKVSAKNSEIAELEKSECKVKAQGIGQRKGMLDTELQSVVRERESAIADLAENTRSMSGRLNECKIEVNNTIAGEKATLEKQFSDANRTIGGHTQESMQERSVAIADAKEKIEKVKIDFTSNSSKISSAVEDRIRADSELNMKTKELKSLSDLRDSGKCPTCGNTWDEKVMNDTILNVEEDIKAATLDLSNKKKEIDILTDREKGFSNTMTDLQSVISDEAVLAADIERIKAAQATIASCKERAGGIKTREDRLIAEIAELEGKVADSKSKLDKRTAEYDDREMKMKVLVDECQAEMDQVMREVADIDDKVSILRNEITALQNSKTEVAAEIGRIDEKLESRKKDLADIAELKRKMKEEKRILERIEYFEKLLGGSIKNDVAESCIPLLNFYANEFLAILRDGMRIEIVSDGKNIPIKIVGSTASTYNMLSGGEQSALRLSVSMALSMISIGSSADLPDMIFLDEIFGALDAKTRDNVFRLLKRLNRNFERIIVITHDQLIKERFRTKIHIDKRDGISRLSF